MAIDTSHPNRQLDYAVALALGWTDLRAPTLPAHSRDGVTGQPPFDWEPHGKTQGIGRRHVDDFSRSDAAAVGVLRFLRSRGWDWCAEDCGAGVLVDIFEGGSSESVLSADAPTLPLAVCGAVLLRFGGPELEAKLAATEAVIDAGF